MTEVGWVAWSMGAAWSVGSKSGLRLDFKSHQLAPGVCLVADGVLPMAATRADGWSITSTGVPLTLEAHELPAWLVDAFGGKWVKA